MQPKAPKKPKIVQVIGDMDGRLAGILYDNGRVFLWNWTTDDEGTWAELTYPDLEAIHQNQEFVECDDCRRKPGSPALCASCLRRRDEFYASRKL